MGKKIKNMLDINLFIEDFKYQVITILNLY